MISTRWMQHRLRPLYQGCWRRKRGTRSLRYRPRPAVVRRLPAIRRHMLVAFCWFVTEPVGSVNCDRRRDHAGGYRVVIDVETFRYLDCTTSRRWGPTRRTPPPPRRNALTRNAVALFYRCGGLIVTRWGYSASEAVENREFNA